MKGSEVAKIHPEYSPTTKKVFRPRQLALFTDTPDPIPIGIYQEPEDGEELVIDEGLSVVKSENTSRLVISGFGVYIGKKSERVTVKKEKKVIYEFPLFRISEIVIASSKGISFSSDLIAELCQRGIHLSFLSYTGKPYAMLTSPMLTATTITRREQILAFEDKRGIDFSKIIVEGKLRNQEKLLLYFNKHVKKKDSKRAEKLEELAKSIKAIRDKVKQVQGKKIDEVRGTLTGLEGSGSKQYWDGVKEIINQKFEFLGRVHRGAPDVVNSLLNYGYGILYSQVWGAVLQAGLEPFAGFMHVDRPGKSSLVLDLVEEFRQPVVDRMVIAHVNLGEVHKMQDGLLDMQTRESITQRILERLESPETYEGKKYKISSIIQMQARHLALFLRGERKYIPFRFKW